MRSILSHIIPYGVMMMQGDRPTAIDLFAGAGGLSEGFKRVGFRIVTAVEKNCEAAQTYRLNHPDTKLIHDDIRSVTAEILSCNYPTDVLMGGFPCKPFSLANQRVRRERGKPHPDEGLYMEFFRLLEEIQPSMFLLENVLELHRTFRDPTVYRSVLDEIKENGNRLGYHVEYFLVRMAEYGLPQKRERIFIVGARHGKVSPVLVDSSTDHTYVTTSMALSDLVSTPTLAREEVGQYTADPQSEYQEQRRVDSQHLWNHFAPRHREQTLKKIMAVPPGGNFKDIPSGLLSHWDCRKTHNNIYRRPWWDGLAPTVAHTRKTMLLHPLLNRVLSARESARLQGFNDSYRFCGSVTGIYQQIADAVPPIIGEKLARQLYNNL